MAAARLTNNFTTELFHHWNCLADRGFSSCALFPAMVILDQSASSIKWCEYVNQSELPISDNVIVWLRTVLSVFGLLGLNVLNNQKLLGNMS